MPFDIESRCSMPPMTPKFKRFIFELCGRKPLKDLEIIQVNAGSGELGMCNKNVLDAINQEGGEPITGWKVFYNASIGYFVAEFHYIWESPDGDYIDVTEDPHMPVSWFVFDNRYCIELTARQIIGPAVHMAKRNKPGVMCYMIENGDQSGISKDPKYKMAIRDRPEANLIDELGFNQDDCEIIHMPGGVGMCIKVK